MIKKKNDTIDELLQNGTLTLSANSREEIYAKSEELVAAIPDGVQWSRSIVFFDGQKTFTQSYSIIKK